MVAHGGVTEEVVHALRALQIEARVSDIIGVTTWRFGVVSAVTTVTSFRIAVVAVAVALAFDAWSSGNMVGWSEVATDAALTASSFRVVATILAGRPILL